MKLFAGVRIFLGGFLVCGLILLTVACQSTLMSATPTPTFVPPSPTPTLTLAELNPTVWNAWSYGPHAAGYDLGKGPNTYCARCHSPANWDPQAVVDPPPNCVSCKFPFEEKPRVAAGNPLVPETEWQGIRCETCHRISDNTLQLRLSWYDRQTGYYETLNSPTQLCEKCHRDTDTLRHRVDLGSSAHSGFECTSCHDPHSTTASCGHCHGDVVTLLISYSPKHQGLSENGECLTCHPGGMSVHSMEVQHKNITDCIGCHQDVLQPPVAPEAVTAGHLLSHKNVSCVACHDAAGLEVRRLEPDQHFMTFRTTVIESLGRPVTSAYTSHMLQRQVNCARCHYAGNPWGLRESVASSSQ